MSPSIDIDLDAPFKEDIILEVRSSKMKTMPGLNILSGIDKTMRDGIVLVNHLGIEGDEHDPTFHGGRDKAVHGCECGFCVPLFLKWICRLISTRLLVALSQVASGIPRECIKLQAWGLWREFGDCAHE